LISILVLIVGACAFASELTSTSEARIPKRDAASTHVAQTPAAATGAFGLDLMRTQPPGNLVLSPNSIATALAMAGTGAAGRTAAQIARTLHLTKPAAFKAVGNLQRTIAKEQAVAGQDHPKAPTLELANGLFLQQGFSVKPTFVSGLQRHFGTVLESIDFRGDPTGSLNTINDWVSEHTMGVIPSLLTSLPKETQLALTNAAYLKADWLHPFDSAHTTLAPFHNRAGSTSVEFMHQTEQLRYGSGKGYQAVDLPYRASSLSMLVVLPREKSVARLQGRLDAKGLARIVRGLSRRPVRLSLPRFHLTSKVKLKNALRSLGMTAAFDESADFSRISAAIELKIDLVEHAADLKVDEEGTTAAAATVVVFVPTSKPKPPPAITFNANHPFLFFLHDNRTGAVLFAGRLTNPASAGI
jgi:serpin B